MFNNTIMKLGNNSQTVQFNAPCTGILQKSNPKSIFVRFQKNSNLEGCVFPSNGQPPYIHEFRYDESGYGEYKSHKIEVIVLQVLIFGDNQYLCEVIEPKYLTEES